MRILILSQWFQPEPTFKGLPLAKALQAKGHAVEVLTGFPNYPGGRLYPGYKLRLWKREVVDGIRITRVILYPSHDRSALRRVFNYMSFALSTSLLGTFLVKKPDIVYAFNLVTLGPTTHLLRLRFGSSIILDVQDLWPDSVIDSEMIKNGFFHAMLARYCRIVYQDADHLIALSPGMKAELVRRGIDQSKISVVYNWCEDKTIVKGEDGEKPLLAPNLNGRFVAMYAGNMGVMQRLDILLEAAEKIGKIEANIALVFVGGGVDRERLKNIAQLKALKNVFFLERQPPERMPSIYRLADVLLVHLKDTNLFRMTIPSKIQAYMAAGKPMIAGIRGDAADLIRVSGSGKAVNPESPEELAESILGFFRMPILERTEMGTRGRDYYDKHLAMNVGVDRIEKIFVANCQR